VIQIFHNHLANNNLWLFHLQRANCENSWVCVYRVEVSRVQSLVESHKLCDERHVRVHNGSLLPHELEASLPLLALRFHEVSHYDGTGPGDPLDAMHKNSAVFLFCLIKEIDCVIKYTFNVFSYIVFQVIGFVC
jgi:hypothetical protein